MAKQETIQTYFIGITGIFTAIMTVVIYWQGYTISNQTKLLKQKFDQENRPYLYIEITPVAFSSEDQSKNNEVYWNLFTGAELKFKNMGKLI